MTEGLTHTAGTQRIEVIRYSVTVPTYRRRDLVESCLRGIAALEYSRKEFEVIVVDDGSGDPPYDVLQRSGLGDIARLIALPENRGPATARNVGASHANGTYLVFLDDDCVPHPQWLRALDWKFAKHPRVLVGGGLRNGARDNVYAEASHQLISFLSEYYNVDPGNARWFTSANIACGRDQFNEIGGFGPGFPLAASEDRDFCDRWREAGFRLTLAHDAWVEHRRSMTLPQFFRQHYTYGRGKHYLQEARIRRGAESHQLEPLHFYLRLVFHPFTDRSGSRAPLLMAFVLLALLLVSQVAYARGYFTERWHARQAKALGAHPRAAAVRPIESAVHHEVLEQPELLGAESRTS